MLTTMKISMKTMNLGKKVRGKDLHWTKNINFNSDRYKKYNNFGFYSIE